MYLRQVYIENSGPIARIDLELALSADGAPKPLVLVGPNGGGKTNLLSLVTDALFEAASVHYENVLPARRMGHAWFRVVGGRTITVGATGGFSLLRFEHKGESLLYIEKAGDVDPATAAKRVPSYAANQISWPKDGAYKHFNVGDETSRLIFEEGVYAHFPSSRSEDPFWLNQETVPQTEFDIFKQISKNLRRPIYIERSLQQFKQWLISVILESRLNIEIQPQEGLTANQNDIGLSLTSRVTMNICNDILRKVIDDPDARFIWLGRKTGDKVAIASGERLVLPYLDGLSGGQSTLLSLFGTLLRYADYTSQRPSINISQVEGICIIDEVDSHIHVDLQHKTLSSLISMFPRVQFILSSHSPLFVIGMEKRFGSAGFQLVEMPGGKNVTAETYSEFGKAWEALSVTTAFDDRVLSQTVANGLPVVFVEGETDSPYLRRAAELLDRQQLLDRCDIEWIGAKDEGGQGFYTGKGALDHTLALLRANPKLMNRPILLLYDNDTRKTDADFGSVCVRIMPTNAENNKVRVGIENLLRESSIIDEDYETISSTKPNGDEVTRKALRKAHLCERLCKQGRRGDFVGFEAALDIIESFLDSMKSAM
jgi:hypothetical protein